MALPLSLTMQKQYFLIFLLTICHSVFHVPNVCEFDFYVYLCHGPLARYVKLRVAHASGMPGTFSLPPASKETACQRSRHASRHVRHARAVMHVGIAKPQWRGKRSRHSRRMRNSQFYVSVKRPMADLSTICTPCHTKVQSFSKHAQCKSCNYKHHATCVRLDR